MLVPLSDLVLCSIGAKASAPQPVRPSGVGSAGPSADDGGAATPLAATTEVPRCRDDGARVNNRLVDLGVRRRGPSKAPSHILRT